MYTYIYKFMDHQNNMENRISEYLKDMIFNQSI